VKRPVIVNGNCSVTYAHCTKSNGGLWYRNFDEFAQALEFLRCNPARAAAMGKNGEQYVEYNYGWDGVMNKYSSVFAELDAGEK
jgi:glycosyltransferase involved in cell wall biosynthesis